jgi:hypothetical protein
MLSFSFIIKGCSVVGAGISRGPKTPRIRERILEKTIREYIDNNREKQWENKRIKRVF